MYCAPTPPVLIKPVPDPVVALALSNISAAVRASPTPEWASAECLRVLVLASARVRLLERTLGAVFRWGPANNESHLPVASSRSSH